jgi:hypothetical protein
VFSEMKKELRNREAAGWARVAWGLAQKPALNEMAVVHGRLIYLNPKVRFRLCVLGSKSTMDDHSNSFFLDTDQAFFSTSSCSGQSIVCCGRNCAAVLLP